MVLEIQEKDNTFRVKWQVNSQGFSTDWIPDTPSNRKSVLVFLRLLRNDKGKRLFTFRELSLLFGGNSRQVASQHMEAFRDYGVKHILCHFHHQGVTRWLKKRYKEDKDIDERKSKMKKVFQTTDKRTVRRRLGKLKESSESLGISVSAIRHIKAS